MKISDLDPTMEPTSLFEAVMISEYLDMDEYLPDFSFSKGEIEWT